MQHLENCSKFGPLGRIKLPIKKITASGKMLGIGAGSVEADLTEEKKITGTLLMGQ
jgi:hypothetical protein